MPALEPARSNADQYGSDLILGDGTVSLHIGDSHNIHLHLWDKMPISLSTDSTVQLIEQDIGSYPMFQMAPAVSSAVMLGEAPRASGCQGPGVSCWCPVAGALRYLCCDAHGSRKASHPEFTVLHTYMPFQYQTVLLLSPLKIGLKTN